MPQFIPPLEPEPGSNPVDDPEKAAAVKAWFAEELRLGDDAVISVMQSACMDPSCPLVEMVVGVFEEGRTRKWKLARPRYAVTRAMVRFAIRMNPDGVV